MKCVSCGKQMSIKETEFIAKGRFETGLPACKEGKERIEGKSKKWIMPCDSCEHDTRPHWTLKECEGCMVPNWYGYKKQELVYLL